MLCISEQFPRYLCNKQEVNTRRNKMDGNSELPKECRRLGAQLVSTFLKLPKTKTSKNFQLSETFARPFETLAIFSKHLKEEGKSF